MWKFVQRLRVIRRGEIAHTTHSLLPVVMPIPLKLQQPSVRTETKFLNESRRQMPRAKQPSALNIPKTGLGKSGESQLAVVQVKHQRGVASEHTFRHLENALQPV